MHSSCNLIKSSNTSVKGDIEIVTECVVTEEEQHFQEIENNQIKSYEVIGASILDKARKDSDHIIMEAFQYLINPVLEQFRGEENIVIKCNGNYIVAIESKVNEWKKSYAISGEILVLEDPLMELGNAVLEKSTGKVVVGLDVSLEKLEESIKEFCGEEDA